MKVMDLNKIKDALIWKLNYLDKIDKNKEKIKEIENLLLEIRNIDERLGYIQDKFMKIIME